MQTLSDRLEIRLPPETLQRLRREAQRRGVSVGALVREAVERFWEEGGQQRLGAAEALFKVNAPVGDWPQMKREIEEAHREALP